MVDCINEAVKSNFEEKHFERLVTYTSSFPFPYNIHVCTRITKPK